MIIIVPQLLLTAILPIRSELQAIQRPARHPQSEHNSGTRNPVAFTGIRRSVVMSVGHSDESEQGKLSNLVNRRNDIFTFPIFVKRQFTSFDRTYYWQVASIFSETCGTNSLNKKTNRKSSSKPYGEELVLRENRNRFTRDFSLYFFPNDNIHIKMRFNILLPKI